MSRLSCSSNLRHLAICSVVAATLLQGAAGTAGEYTGVLAEPVPLGAWLYVGNCLQCHGKYTTSRLGENYSDEGELREAIGHRGCRISWSRSRGGPFGPGEIDALATYMRTWEEQGEAPTLPELPPQPMQQERRPKETIPAVSDDAATPDSTEPGSEQRSLPPALLRFIEREPVAAGAYLYTSHCYRCHLDYQRARMGKGVARETVSRFITEGKTSTQMKAFSNQRGGPLAASEIRRIVAYITTWETKGESLAIAAELLTPPALDPAQMQPIRLTRFLPVRGDAQEGHHLFARHCGICHGPTGEGFTAPPLRAARSGLRPDLFFKSVIKTGIPNTLMVSWDTGRKGPLSPKNIDDIVSHLLSL